MFRVLDFPLYAFIASIPFETIGSRNGGAVDATISWALGILWAITSVLDTRVKLKRFPPVLIAMTLLAIVYFGFSLPINPFLRDMSNHFSLLLLQMTIMIWLIIGVVSERPYMYQRIAWIFAVSCAVTSFLQLLGLGFAVNVVDKVRVAAIGEDPNTWCGKLAVGFVLAAGLALRWKHLSFLPIVTFSFVCLMIVPAALQSGSRTGLASIVVGISVLGISSIMPSKGLSRFRRAALVIAASGTLIWGIGGSTLTATRWTSALTTGDMASRQFVYPEELRMIMAKPLLGWGPVQNGVELCSKVGACKGTRSTENTFGWALTSLGILGSAPFFYVLGTAWKCALRLRRTVLGWTPLAALSTTLAISCGIEWYHVKVYWLIIGLTIAAAEMPISRGRAWIGSPVHFGLRPEPK
jgi:hypothetical protein